MESKKGPGRTRITGSRNPSAPTGAGRPKRREDDTFKGSSERSYARKKSEGTEGEQPARRSRMVSKDYSPRPEQDSNSERPRRSASNFNRDDRPSFGPRKTGFGGARRSEDRPARPFSGSDRKPAGNRSARPYSKPSGEDGDRPKRFSKDRDGDRGFSARPKRSFDSKGGEDRERKPRPFAGRDARPARSNDRPSYPRKPFGAKSGDQDFPRPSRFSNKPSTRSSSFSDKPRRNYEGDAERKPGRSFEKRSFNRDSPRFESSGPKEKRGYSTPAEGEDRPKRRFEKESSSTDSAPSTRRKPPVDRPGKTYGHNRRQNREAAEVGIKGIRLNKYLANAGLCSRREADQFIQSGVVEVNGEIITELGHKIQSDDVVLFGGKRVSGETPTYVLLNKPKDYLTTTKDPQQRKTVMELVGTLTRMRVYPVGRLDRQTTGVLMLTNDGDLADRLLHPSRKISKVYTVEVDKRFKVKDLKALQKGIELEDGFIQPDEISMVEGGTNTQIGIKIHSGRNRIVRRMIEHFGYQVLKLDRVMFAGLTKKGLKRGQARFLTEEEVVMLRRQ